LADLLIPANPAEIFNIDSPETTQDTSRPSKIKKTEEIHYLDSASMKTASISLDQGGGDAKLNDTEIKQQQGDEVDPLKKRKGSPLKPSSQKKLNATMTNMQTFLTFGDFDFVVASLNDDSLEIAEKQETKKEGLYDRIMTEL
jgi:hypothetical protein